MKSIHIFLFLFFSFVAYSQKVEIQGEIKEDLTHKPIPYASITYLLKDIGCYATESGTFTLPLTTHVADSLIQISSIGFKTKILNINTLSKTIFLEPVSDQLQELLIEKTKRKPNKTVHFGVRQTKPKIRTSLPFGYEVATYIQNIHEKSGIVKEVVLSLNKNTKSDFVASYNLKFYTYDSLTNKPGKLLYNDNIIVQPENKTYKLKIEVEDLNIPLPKSGICVGIEILNTKGFKTTDLISVAPYINFTETDKSKITWSAFRNKDWIKRTRESHLKRGSFINAKIELTGKI